MVKVNLRLRVPRRRKFISYCCGGMQGAIVVLRVSLRVVRLFHLFVCLVCIVVATSSVWKRNNKSGVVDSRSYKCDQRQWISSWLDLSVVLPLLRNRRGSACRFDHWREGRQACDHQFLFVIYGSCHARLSLLSCCGALHG